MGRGRHFFFDFLRAFFRPACERIPAANRLSFLDVRELARILPASVRPLRSDCFFVLGYRVVATASDLSSRRSSWQLAAGLDRRRHPVRMDRQAGADETPAPGLAVAAYAMVRRYGGGYPDSDSRVSGSPLRGRVRARRVSSGTGPPGVSP